MMSSCWQVTFRPAAPDNETLENFLEQYFEVTACNYDDDGNDEYVGYQSGTFDEKAMVEAAHAAAINLPPYEVTFLESSNWLKDYVIKFAPFETEDFMFYGIHETSCPQTSLIPVQIYAATAFGSDHQTTRSCIKALSRLYHQGFSADNILDVGTGSGILSLAAAKLWGEKCAVTAVDIDEEAVWVTRQNAQNNSVDHLITAEVSDGFHAGIVKQNAPYQLILPISLPVRFWTWRRTWPHRWLPAVMPFCPGLLKTRRIGLYRHISKTGSNLLNYTRWTTGVPPL